MIGSTLLVTWTLLAVFLIFGLVLYERTGRRLGGVLVLPLLVIYALFDLAALAVFSVAAAISFAVGHLVYHRTFLYGRRLLYVFLLVGIAATMAARLIIDTDLGVVVLAVLPGLFAYNLQREGRYLEGASAFFLWFGILLGCAAVALWLLAGLQGARPDAPMAGVMAAGIGALLHGGAALGPPEPGILEGAMGAAALAAGASTLIDAAGDAE